MVLQLLAGNCLPYHQPNCPTTDKPTKVLEPTWFLLAFRGRRFCWEPPLSELFSVVKIDRTALLFPLATSDAASHAVDATDRGHTGPVKNGDAFERLGTMTTLADRKGTVKGCDILS